MTASRLVALPRTRGGRRFATGVDRLADRRDLRRRRAAAAADHARAERTRARGEVGEVVGCGVRERDACAGHRRQADVRQRCERRLAAHLGESGQRRRRPAAVVRAERVDAELAQAGRPRRARAHPRASAPSESKLISATIGSCDTERTALDRQLELVQVVERLEHEEVGAAALEDPRLLGEELQMALRAQLDVAERPDRAADEHVAAAHLAGVARELHGLPS